MQTLKGGWAGQTFALAKCNESDSGSRKSRIRRSKQERKSMVESFIQKYQKQNNGNFPSLNLTQEEVGGSFYTVREIVREIIQENRVLGPAKVAAEDDTSSEFVEQYPLGSIAIEPQIPPLPSPSGGLDPDVKTSLVKDIYKEMEVVSNRHYNGNEFVKDAVINGSQTDYRNEESNGAACTGLGAAENVGTGVIVNGSVSAASKSNITSVEVETFPLKAVTVKNDCLQVTSGDLRDSPGTIEEKHSNEETPRIAISDSELDGLNSEEKSSLLDEEADLNHENALVRESSIAGNMKEVVNLVDTRSSVFSTTSEGIVRDVDNRATANNNVLIDAIVSKDLEEIKHIAEIQGQNDEHKKSVEQETKMEGDNDSGIKDSSNPTLDRINLESWEVSSSKNTSAKNPVLVILKAFILSFVKFWTE